MVTNLQDYSTSLKLKAFDSFDIGIFGNIQTKKGNLIGDMLIRFLQDDNIQVHCNRDGYLVPMLRKNSTGNSYRDLCIYFDVDFLVGIGLFGNATQNWQWYLQANGIYDTDRYIRVANQYWTNYGLFPQCEQAQLECQLHNLQIYNGLSGSLQRKLGYRLTRLFNITDK